MKKYLSLAAVAALLLSAMPMSHVSAAGADDLVKCADFSSVYYIADDGKRYVFPNENMYYSWYPDFRSVKTISCDDLANFALGGRLVYQPGTSLVKIPSDPSVFAVESDGVLREIPDEETAEKLFGDDWSERVDDVSESFWSSFTVGEPLSPGEIPEGTVVEDHDGNLFRVDTEGVAVEIDAVLDTDDEEVLADNALAMDDIETRLGVALALLRVDAQTAIDVLQRIIADLRPIHVDDEDEVEVEDVDEIDDEDGAQEDAEDAISDAREEMADAREDMNEDAADGDNVSERETHLATAAEKIALAEASAAVGEYSVAEAQADEARREAQRARGKAVDEMENEDEDESDQEESDEESDDDVTHDSDLTDNSDSEDESDEDESNDDESEMR